MDKRNFVSLFSFCAICCCNELCLLCKGRHNFGTVYNAASAPSARQRASKREMRSCAGGWEKMVTRYWRAWILRDEKFLIRLHLSREKKVSSSICTWLKRVRFTCEPLVTTKRVRQWEEPLLLFALSLSPAQLFSLMAALALTWPTSTCTSK